MTAFTELYSVETEQTEKFPEGLVVMAYKSYSGYEDALIYGVSVTDYATLDEIDEVETTYQDLEKEFNKLLRKYGVKNAKWLYI